MKDVEISYRVDSSQCSAKKEIRKFVDKILEWDISSFINQIKQNRINKNYNNCIKFLLISKK